MTGATHVAYLACIGANVLVRGVSRKTTITVAVTLALVLLSTSAAQAQCVTAGQAASSHGMAPWRGAIASGSASAAALVSSINSVDTAFLTQSGAFIGSPSSRRPDQQGGQRSVWTRSVGGHFDYGTSTEVAPDGTMTPSLVPALAISLGPRQLQLD